MVRVVCPALYQEGHGFESLVVTDSVNVSVNGSDGHVNCPDCTQLWTPRPLGLDLPSRCDF